LLSFTNFPNTSTEDKNQDFHNLNSVKRYSLSRDDKWV
jgi:hypothetical protein